MTQEPTSAAPPAPPPRFSRGLRYMAAAGFFFSIMSLLVKLAGRRLPSQEVVLVRSLAMMILSAGALRRAGVGLWGRRRRLLVVRGTLGFAALLCFYYALIHLPLADATVIQYTNPAFTGIFAIWVLGEAMTGGELACMLTSLAGVVLIARPSFLFGAGMSRLPLLAVGIALAGAVFSGAAYVFVRKLGATEPPLVIIFYFALVSVLGSLPLLGRNARWPTPLEWLVLLGVGVSAQIAQLYMTRGLGMERAGRAMSVAYVQVLFAALWGILFFGERPDLWAAGGAVLVLGSTWALAHHGRAAG